MQVGMTPNIQQVDTPVVFQQAMPPWVTQTPEPSPMLWGRVPVNEGYLGHPEISKEFLRSVCEPFFEQMLGAVHQALVAQSQQAMHMQGQRWHQMPPASTNQGLGRTCDERSTEEGSDNVSDSGGAFSTIFSPHSNLMTEHESVKYGVDVPTKANDEAKDIEMPRSGGAEMQIRKAAGEPSQAQATVCRHWKSKGWCRMEANCKFLHPEHKRGVGAVNGKPCGMSGDGNADTSGALALASISSDQLQALAMDAKNKAAKKRKSKGKSGVSKEDSSASRQLLDTQLAGDEQSVSIVHSFPCSTEYPALMLQSAS